MCPSDSEHDRDNSNQKLALEEARRMEAEYRREDRFLRGASFEAAHRLDRALLAVSTSSLGFTVALAQYAPQLITWTIMPIVWLLFGLSIVCTVLSMKTSVEHFFYRVKEVEHVEETKLSRHLDAHSLRNPYVPGDPPQETESWLAQRGGSMTVWLNWFAIGYFVAGVIIFVLMLMLTLHIHA